MNGAIDHVTSVCALVGLFGACGHLQPPPPPTAPRTMIQILTEKIFLGPPTHPPDLAWYKFRPKKIFLEPPRDHPPTENTKKRYQVQRNLCGADTMLISILVLVNQSIFHRTLNGIRTNCTRMGRMYIIVKTKELFIFPSIVACIFRILSTSTNEINFPSTEKVKMVLVCTIK